MKPLRNKLQRALVAVAAAAGIVTLGACDDVIQDPTFRLWCGDDKLCSWNVDSGRIRRAATWHEDDWGVSFEETPTRISQTLRSTPPCLLFTTVANVEPTAQLAVELDFDGDGKVDASYPIPQAAWREEKTLISAPDVYGPNATLAIHKRGPGRAVLAELRVQKRDTCDRTSVPPVQGLRVGQACSQSAQCGSGVCCAGMCGECCPVLVPDQRPSPCAADRCQEREDTCKKSAFFAGQNSPFQCDPGKGLAQSGAPCTQNEDCGSGACEGAIVRTTPPTAADGGAACDPQAKPKSGVLVTSAIAGRCR